MKGVSIIICCFNSSSRLPCTLKYLASQEVPKEVNWEVIIVDNASTDNTAEVAKNEWKKLRTPTSLRIEEESKAGLSFAREKGLNTAKYDYCIFCDDDNWLQKDYIRLSFEKMELDESIGVIGGYGHPVCEVDPPKWFEMHKNAFAVGPQARESGDVSFLTGVVYGAGIVIRKKVYESFRRNNLKTLLTDRVGRKLTSGNDSEICFIMILLGYRVFYCSELEFKHFIPEERLTTSYLQKLYSGFRSARPVLSLYYYKVFNPKILDKKSLWLREVLFSLRKEVLAAQFHLPYTMELIKNKKRFCKALMQIKSYNRSL